MSLQKFGLRYERLLILSAPISLACILVAFVAIASDFAKSKFEAQCRETAASIIEKNKSNLEEAWRRRETVGKVVFAHHYIYEVDMLMIGKLSYQCSRDITRQDSTKTLPPGEFIAKLRADAARILEQSNGRPVRSYGIELPERAKISLFGTNITISIYTLAQMMQIVLFPILILWLGSLFNTRYRETLLIENAVRISDLYPHVVNVYLNASLPALRKRSWFGYYFKKLLPYFPSLIRILLLCVFIAPPTIFYCASLFYLSSDEHTLLSVGAGVMIFLFFITNIFSELNMWHAGKKFPGAENFQSSLTGWPSEKATV